MSYEYKQFYRRKLPHIHSPRSTLFVTFRLVDTIPAAVLRRWLAEKSLLARRPTTDAEELEFRRHWFRRFEDILDKHAAGPMWLAKPAVAQIVADSLKYRDGRVYRLHAFCIMSNHVHTVFTPNLNERSIIEVKNSSPLKFRSSEMPLSSIMKSLKGRTAREANKVLNRTGQFWEEESYDHEIRSEAEFNRTVRYVLDNPVKAGLVKHWSEWKWTYCRPDLKFD